jgi:magnesium-transporting ATPase (P-type)
MATNEDAAKQAEPERTKKETPESFTESDQASSPLSGLRATGRAARRLFGNWRALLILLLLYAALIASVYFFIAVREASAWQVLATFLLALIAPVLFFIIQTIGVRYVEDGVRTRDLLRWSVRDFWKLLLVTVPVLLLVWFVAYLFGKFQLATPAAVAEAARAGAGAAATAARPPARTVSEAFSWKEVILTTLRFLILGLVLPLMAIHLWIAAARRGLVGALRTIKSVMAAALAPGAVLVYGIGLLLFGVIPYFLITTNYSRGGAWTEIGLLGGRLLLASLFMLCGWIITLGALSILSPERTREQAISEQANDEAAETASADVE